MSTLPSPRTSPHWMGRHPSTTHFEELFAYAHLPGHLQDISRPFGNLAERLLELLGDGPELSAGLRKLLEAKDCMVRQAVQDLLAGSKSIDEEIVRLGGVENPEDGSDPESTPNNRCPDCGAWLSGAWLSEDGTHGHYEYCPRAD